MSATPDSPEHVTPAHDGSDLAALREEIDALQAIPREELVNPLPKSIEEREPTPHATDALGTEKWDEPADEETLEN